MKYIKASILSIGRFSSSSAAFAPANIIHSTNKYRSSFLSSSSAKALIHNMSTKRVLVPIADDSEEIETTCITDTLTRFGAEVVVASVKANGDLLCKMSRGIKIMADISIDEATGQDWDLVALPGGMPGAEHLRDSAALISILEKQKVAGKSYAAICASPAVVLASKGLLGEGATCYPAPGLLSKMTSPVNDDVVVQGNVITSKGPGTSIKFAIALGRHLYGPEKAAEIAGDMLVV